MNSSLFTSLEISEYDFNQKGLEYIRDNKYVKNYWPLTYIISDDKKGEAYVGESTNALSRLRNHISNKERKKLKRVHLVTSDKFNKSAVLDIEANLIKYLSADGQFQLQNANAGLANHNYYDRDNYFELFKRIWKELKKENLVKNELYKIDNSDLFKYSPYKSLSSDQHDGVIELVKFLKNDKQETAIIEGSAGTGKTILAVYFIKLLMSKDLIDKDYTDDNSINDLQLLKELGDKMPDPKVALVVPMTSLRKTLKKVFRHVKGLKSSMVIGPSQVVKEKYDLLIVDEAHRLRRRKNITNYASFDNANKALGFDKGHDELDWVIHQSKKQVFFYDEFQSIRPSDIVREKFKKLKDKKSSVYIPLVSQHRVDAGNDYINFVDKLLNVRVDGRSKPFSSEDYELLLFSSLEKMKKRLEKKEKEHGLCRLVAGYAWEWKSKNKNVPDIEIEDLELQWNSTTEDWINSDHAFEEVGCIHTTQGYDLNYVGIIFGPEITYNSELKKIEIIKENYHDRNGKAGIEDPEKLKAYIINIYKTLMLRGIKGTYLYVCDERLRGYFEDFIKVK